MAFNYPSNYPPPLSSMEITDHSAIIKWVPYSSSAAAALSGHGSSGSLDRSRKSVIPGANSVTDSQPNSKVDLRINMMRSRRLAAGIDANSGGLSLPASTTGSTGLLPSIGNASPGFNRRQSTMRQTSNVSSDFASIYSLSYIYLGQGRSLELSATDDTSNLEGSDIFVIVKPQQPPEDKISNEKSKSNTTREANRPLDYVTIYTGPKSSFKVEDLDENSKYRFVLKARAAQSHETNSLIPVVDPSIDEWYIRAKDRCLLSLISDIMNKQSLEAMELLNNKSHLLSEYMNSRDKEGKTILMLACGKFIQNPEIIEKMCLMGASVDAPTMVGKTALTVCATVGNVKGAEILLQYGASVENKDNSGTTPLMWACETGNLEVAKLLLSKGASPYTTDSKQNTPLHRISMITAQTMPSAITVDVARLLFAAVKHAETDPDDSTPNNDAHRPSSAKPGAALDRALANASTKSLLPLTGSNSSLAKTPVPMVNVVGVPGLNKTVPSPVINISEESSAHSGRTRSRSGATPEHVSNLRNLVSTTSAPALPSENYKSRRPSSLSKTAESSLKVQLNVTVEGTSQEELDATRNVSSLKQISSHGKTNVGILPPLLAPLNILERPSSGRIGMAPVSPMLGGRRNFAAPSKVCSDYINLKNESQMTAVLSCALNGNRPLLEVLVENGGDYNEVTPSGHNAIMLAKTNRHAGTVAYLESLIPQKNDF